MTVTAVEIMTLGGQDLPFSRDLREALGIYARRTWPLRTSVQAAQAWNIDKKTAANLLKGHASDATITRVLRAGGWDMAAPVIGSVVGQTLEQHLDQKLEAIRAEQSRLNELQQAAATRWALLVTGRLAAVGELRPEAGGEVARPGPGRDGPRRPKVRRR